MSHVLQLLGRWVYATAKQDRRCYFILRRGAWVRIPRWLMLAYEREAKRCLQEDPLPGRLR